MRFKMNQGDLHEVLKSCASTGRDEGVIKVKKGGWLMMCQSENSVATFASKVPESEMEDWDPGDTAKIGFKFDKPKKFLDSGGPPVVVETYQTSGGTNKLRFSKGSDTIEIPTVAIEYVDSDVSRVPSIDWVAEIEGDLRFFEDFIKKSDNVVSSAYYIIGVREESLYLYTEKDDTRSWDSFDWDDFEDHNINWENGTQEKEEFNNPVEDKAADTILSTDWSSNLYFPSDKGKLHFNNHTPIKIVFDMESDMKASYFIAPRIVDDGKSATVPDDVLN